MNYTYFFELNSDKTNVYTLKKSILTSYWNTTSLLLKILKNFKNIWNYFQFNRLVEPPKYDGLILP